MFLLSTLRVARSVDVPIGHLEQFPYNELPSGFIICDGSIISRITYRRLFAKIGTIYNTGGEGPDEFRLPDYRAEFLRGWDPSGSIDNSRPFGSLQAAQLGAHLHPKGNIAAGAVNIPHSHATTTDAANAPHNHDMRISTRPAAGSSSTDRTDAAGAQYTATNSSLYIQNINTDSGTYGGHPHPIGTHPASNIPHNHTVSGTVDYTGGPNLDTETRPRNRTLIYMIKY
jgi:microcystin-dependent protein